MRKKSAHLAFSAALMSLMVMAPLGANSAFAQTAEDGSLDWGIRSGFNNYTGGATQVIDGASKSPTGFTFELVSKRQESAGNLTDLQFNGTVVYRKYCSIPDKPLEGTCALDLRFNDPRIVISDNGSYLEATVSSKQFPSGELWEPKTPVRVADLHTSSAILTEQNGRVTWSNISATLTEDSYKMFTGFYEPGEQLDPISISYSGQAIRPVGDSGKPELTDALWDSKKEYGDGPHIMVDADPHILVGEPGGNIVLIDQSLKELARTTATIPKSSTYAYDKKSKTVYYTTLRNRNELYAVAIEGDKFGQEKVVFTATNNITAIGVNAAGEVAAITLSPDFRTAALVTNASGDFVQLDLPSSEELLGAQLTGGSVWGSSSFGENIELLPMKDNTFVYNGEGDPYLNGDSTSAKGLLVSINANGATPGERAQYMPGSDHGNRTAYVNNLASNGESIYRFTASPYGATTTTQILKYADRNVTSVTNVSKEGAAGIAAVGFAPDGTPILLEGNAGTLQYLRPNTFEVTSEVPLPRGKSTQKAANNTFVVRDNAIFVPTFDDSRGDYLDHYALRKFKLPVPAKAPESTSDDKAKLDELAAKAQELAAAKKEQENAAAQKTEDQKSADDNPAAKATDIKPEAKSEKGKTLANTGGSQPAGVALAAALAAVLIGGSAVFYGKRRESQNS